MKWIVFYRKNPTFREDVRLIKNDVLDNKTHIYVDSLDAPNPEEVFRLMQAEFWSPNGEKRSYIKSQGLSHTSMSVGDVIGTYALNRLFLLQCCSSGWKRVPTARKPEISNLGEIVGWFKAFEQRAEEYSESLSVYGAPSECYSDMHRSLEKSLTKLQNMVEKKTGKPFTFIEQELSERVDAKWRYRYSPM